MASAEEYAKWIVDNQDKQGTPEFETVAKAYQVARQGVQPAQPQPAQSRPILEAFLAGGPIQAAMAGGGEALKSMSNIMDRAAYGAGEKVSEVAHNFGASPEVAGGLGYAANVGVQALPTVLSGNLAKTVFERPIRHGAEILMQSALKPSIKSLRTGEAATAIDTMLKEGVNVTPGGLMKLKSKIYALNNEISDAIKNSPAMINKGDVARRINEPLQRFSQQVNPNSDINAIRSAWDEFINHPLLTGAPEISVQAAQKLKQGTYRALKDKYGEVGSASAEAQKALARGLKEEIADVVPDIAALNARESKLLASLNVAERRVLMDANKNPAGLAWLAEHPIAATLFLADRSPLFKSLLARALNASSQQVPATATRAGVGTAMAINNQPE